MIIVEKKREIPSFYKQTSFKPNCTTITSTTQNSKTCSFKVNENNFLSQIQTHWLLLLLKMNECEGKRGRKMTIYQTKLSLSTD